jgi:N-acetylmuramoyl-L-alanine amidase
VITLKDPNRVVLELKAAELTSDLAQLPLRVQPSDPYIAAIRFGTRPPDVLRIVFDSRPKRARSSSRCSRRRIRASRRPRPVSARAVRSADGVSRRASGAEASRRSSARPPPLPRRARPRQAAPRVASARRRITIAIDPGSWRRGPGAIGRRGTYEKNVTLAIGKKLKRLIDADPGMRAMLTRDDDYFVPLAARVQQGAARRGRSLRLDPRRRVPRERGAGLVGLCAVRARRDEHRGEMARAEENAADLIGGVNINSRDPTLARTLLDLSQTAQISDSLKVGRHMLDSIGSINALHKAAVEQAGFAVLKAPDIPSILVETAFISNPEEELKLRNERHQAKFAESMSDAIRRYFAANPPLARRATGTG